MLYETVADLINRHMTPYDIQRKLHISGPQFRDARKRAAAKGLIEYQKQPIGQPSHDPSPRIVESATAALAWQGVRFEDVTFKGRG